MHWLEYYYDEIDVKVDCCEEEEEEYYAGGLASPIASPIDFNTSEFFYAPVDPERYGQREKQYAEQKKAAQNAYDKLFEALKAQIERKRVILPKNLEVDSINGDVVDESIVDEIIEDEERKTQMDAERQKKQEEEDLVRAEQNLKWYMYSMENIQ